MNQICLFLPTHKNNCFVNNLVFGQKKKLFLRSEKCAWKSIKCESGKKSKVIFVDRLMRIFTGKILKQKHDIHILLHYSMQKDDVFFSGLCDPNTAIGQISISICFP